MAELHTVRFHAKAVQVDGLLQGILSIAGSDNIKRNCVRSLYGLFAFDLKNQEIYFYREQIFFYGHSVDLHTNYFKIPEALRKKVLNYKDRLLDDTKTKTETKYTDAAYGYMSIPLEDLCLDRGHQEIAAQCLEKAETRGLVYAVERMLRINLPEDTQKKRRYLAQHLSCTPRAFEEQVKAADCYYRTERSTTKKEEDGLLIFNIQRVILMKEIPSWSEEYIIKQDKKTLVGSEYAAELTAVL